MPAPASEPLRSTRSRRARAPRAWPGARDAIPRPSWVGCTPITPRVPTRSGFAAPAGDPPLRLRRRFETPSAPPSVRPPPHPERGPTRHHGGPSSGWCCLCASASAAAAAARHSAQPCTAASCRGSKLSWKKAKKLLGRADPERREVFVEQLRDVLAGAQRDRHLLVYVDEAHIHQDADLGYGWAERGERFWVASNSPGLSARVSFYGLYLDNEGQVRPRCGSGPIRGPMATTRSRCCNACAPRFPSAS